MTGFCCEGLKTLLGVGLNCGSELLLKMCWYLRLWHETQGFLAKFPSQKRKTLAAKSMSNALAARHTSGASFISL